MANKIILQCWDEEGVDGTIVLDYTKDEDSDERLDTMGITINLGSPIQRIAFWKKDLLLAIEQLGL